VTRLQQSLLPPVVVVVTLEKLLKCCLPQDTVPSALSPET